MLLFPLTFKTSDERSPLICRVELVYSFRNTLGIVQGGRRQTLCLRSTAGTLNMHATWIHFYTNAPDTKA